MRTLLLSAILYLVGVSIVLLLRPKFMFNQDGTWKEFGTTSSEHSMMPFWLFCILWAVFSYLLVLLVVGEFRVSAAATAVALAASSPDNSDDGPVPLPVKTRPKKKSNGELKPGYYVLEQDKGSTPKYVYYGNSPPSLVPDEEDEV